MLENDRLITPYLGRPNLFVLRYEDLVCEPESICRQLYEFLGCDFRTEYLSYDPGADPYPDRWEWVPEASTQFDRWHTVKWKEQLTPAEIEHIVDLAGWFIDKYEYER
jgi:hypothetical protein